MARCPRCSRHFRTLEDEEGMHACPSCGYAPWDEATCAWCAHAFELSDDDDNAPYCSSLCSAQAELDSMEDSE